MSGRLQSRVGVSGFRRRIAVASVVCAGAALVAAAAGQGHGEVRTAGRACHTLSVEANASALWGRL